MAQKISYMLSRAGAPVLLSATLVTGCGGTSKTRDAAPDSGPDASVLVVPPADGPVDRLLPDGLVDLVPSPDRGPVPPSNLCSCGAPYSFTLPFPAEGVAAGALCTQGGGDAGLAVASGLAARVTMDWGGDADSKQTLGTITLAPELMGKVVGLPTVTFVPTSSSDTTQVAISNLRAAGQGFTFDAVWSATPTFACEIADSWTFKTSLQLQCADGGIRAVESSTNLRLCGDQNGSRRTWVSSGDTCYTCAVICEMAPSPIVSAQPGDDLPLGSTFTVAIRSLAKVGNALVLLAEHEGGAGEFTYAWSVSTGDLEILERDVALWRLPDAEIDHVHLAQVAVVGAHAAAVASLRRGPCLA